MADPAALLPAAQAGDEAAMLALWETVAPWCFRIAHRFAVRTGWDSDDAFSEAKVWFFRRALHTWEPRRGALTTFVGFCLPRWLQRCRNLDRTISLPTNLDKAHEADADKAKKIGSLYCVVGWADTVTYDGRDVAESVQVAEECEYLQAAIKLLPDDLRGTLALVMETGSQAEVATMVGVSRERIRQRVNAATRNLTRLIAQLEANPTLFERLKNERVAPIEASHPSLGNRYKSRSDGDPVGAVSRKKGQPGRRAQPQRTARKRAVS